MWSFKNLSASLPCFKPSITLSLSVLGIKPNPLVWPTRSYMSCQPPPPPPVSTAPMSLTSATNTLPPADHIPASTLVFLLFLLSTDLLRTSVPVVPSTGNAAPGASQGWLLPAVHRTTQMSPLPWGSPPTSSPALASIPLPWGSFFMALISLIYFVYLFIVCLVCPSPSHWNVCCREWSSALFIHNTRSPIQNSAWHILCAQNYEFNSKWIQQKPK